MAALVHLAVGFASKPLSRKVPVLVLIVAAELLDIFAILFALIGIERTGLRPVDSWTCYVTGMVHSVWGPRVAIS